MRCFLDEGRVALRTLLNSIIVCNLAKLHVEAWTTFAPMSRSCPAQTRWLSPCIIQKPPAPEMLIARSIVGCTGFEEAVSLEAYGFVEDAIVAFEKLTKKHYLLPSLPPPSSPARCSPLPVPLAELAYLRMRLAHLANDGLGDLRVAEGHLRAALQLDAKGTPAAVLDQLGMVLHTSGNIVDAVNCFEEAVAVFEKRHGPDHLRSVPPRLHLSVAKDVLAMQRQGDGGSCFTSDSDSLFPHWVFRSGTYEGCWNGRRVLCLCSGGSFSSMPSSLVSSWEFAKTHFPRRRVLRGDLYNGTRAVLASALLDHSPLRQISGLPPTVIDATPGAACQGRWMVLEFGVSHGKSIRMLSEMVEEAGAKYPVVTPKQTTVNEQGVYLSAAENGAIIAGFDTFTGLPDSWGDEPKGAYSTGGLLPRVPSRVRLVRGLFANTLRPFLAAERIICSAGSADENKSTGPVHPRLALANVDCDLFDATVDILGSLASSVEATAMTLLPPQVPSLCSAVCAGSVICFDEFFMYEGWQGDEARAYFEAAKCEGWECEYIAWSLASKQVGVKITGTQESRLRAGSGCESTCAATAAVIVRQMCGRVHGEIRSGRSTHCS